jgi:hypothetical protein
MSPLLKDILERAAWTFIQGFATIILASGTLNITVLQAAGVAGGMAVLSLVKSMAASKIGAETPQTGIDTYGY